MSFKLFLRPRPLRVGIKIETPSGLTGDVLEPSWRLPYQGVWSINLIGGGGGSGAYNNSHSHASEGGRNGNIHQTTSFKLIDDNVGVTLGGGGAGGVWSGLTFNAGSDGNSTNFGGISISGGVGGNPSDGTVMYSPPAPTWQQFTTAQSPYFLGTASPYYQDGGTNTGKGADGVYGSLVNNLSGAAGYRGAAVFTCVG